MLLALLLLLLLLLLAIGIAGALVVSALVYAVLAQDGRPWRSRWARALFASLAEFIVGGMACALWRSAVPPHQASAEGPLHEATLPPPMPAHEQGITRPRARA